MQKLVMIASEEEQESLKLEWNGGDRHLVDRKGLKLLVSYEDDADV